MNDPHSDILGELEVTEFLQNYWQKKPVLLRQAFPAFESPLDADELAGLACEEAVESRLIQKHGKRWTLRAGPFDATTLQKLPSSDWTLLVQDVEKHLPDLAEILDRFEFLPHWRIDDLMISIASTGGGVGPHTDAYDVFLLQAAGRRRWSIAEHFDPRCIEGMDLRVLERFEPEQEWVLEPGDMLYLPPNVAHDGVAMDDRCMTWSIGFRAPSLKDMSSDFMEWLYQRLPDDVMYTDPDLMLDEARGGRIAPAGFERMRRQMHSILHADDNILDFWFGCFITEPKHWLRCEPAASKMAGSVLRGKLEHGDALIKDTRARLAWSTIGDKAVLFVDGNGWELDTSLAPLLEIVCTKRHINMQTLPMLSSVDAGIELLVRLHEHGAWHLESEEKYNNGD